MRVEFKSELPFIMKTGILAGNIEPLGGDSYVFRSIDGSFKQNLKKSEYEAMLKASGKSPSAEEGKKEEAPSREEELKAMNMKDLKKIAKKSYDGIDKKATKSELISLILDAEKEEEEKPEE